MKEYNISMFSTTKHIVHLLRFFVSNDGKVIKSVCGKGEKTLNLNFKVLRKKGRNYHADVQKTALITLKFLA